MLRRSSGFRPVEALYCQLVCCPRLTHALTLATLWWALPALLYEPALRCRGRDLHAWQRRARRIYMNGCASRSAIAPGRRRLPVMRLPAAYYMHPCRPPTLGGHSTAAAGQARSLLAAVQIERTAQAARPL
jgi:hypothetical protein